MTPYTTQSSRVRRYPIGWALGVALAGALVWLGISAWLGAGESRAAGDGCFKLALSVAEGKGLVQATPSSAGGCSEGQYPKDYKVSLLATPADGYTFDGWKGADDDKANPTSLTMKSAREVSAYFSAPAAPKCYALTLSVGGGSGTVQATPGSAGDCPAGQYASQSKVTLTATPADGYGFAGWKGIDDEKANPASVTMKGDRQVTGYFARCRRLFISTGGHGTVKASPASAGGCPEGRYVEGSSVILTASPNDGYKLTGWSGTDSNKGNPTKMTMNADRHVSALFVGPTSTPTKPSEKTATPTKHEATSTPTKHDATATPTKHEATATPTKHEATATPTKHEATATPTKSADPEKTATPTKPADPEKTATPTKLPGQDATATPTKPSEPEKTATPTKLPEHDATATPTKPEATPTATKPSDHEKTGTPTKSPEPEKTATPTPFAQLRGDANCDGRVSAVDAVLVLQFDARMITHMECAATADANHDGRVNAVDAALILQVGAGLVSAL